MTKTPPKFSSSFLDLLTTHKLLKQIVFMALLGRMQFCWEGHGITELFVSWKVGGPLAAIQTNSPSMNGDTDSLMRLLMALVQPDPECLQGWGTHHLSGQAVPVLYHLYCKKRFSSNQF